LAASDKAIYVRANTGEIVAVDRAGQATEVYRPTDLAAYLNFWECWVLDGYLVGIEDSGALKAVNLATGLRVNLGSIADGFSGAHMLGNTLYWWREGTLYARPWQDIAFGGTEIVYISGQ
jgi:hypothetical protein